MSEHLLDGVPHDDGRCHDPFLARHIHAPETTARHAVMNVAELRRISGEWRSALREFLDAESELSDREGEALEGAVLVGEGVGVGEAGSVVTDDFLLAADPCRGLGESGGFGEVVVDSAHGSPSVGDSAAGTADVDTPIVGAASGADSFGAPDAIFDGHGEVPPTSPCVHSEAGVSGPPKGVHGATTPKRRWFRDAFVEDIDASHPNALSRLDRLDGVGGER